jgi:hypothetical protein
VLGDGGDQLVGLLAATAGEPLLGPAAGRGPRLHMAAADLALDQLRAVADRDGVAAAAHHDEPDALRRRRLLDQRLERARTQRAPRGE